MTNDLFALTKSQAYELIQLRPLTIGEKQLALFLERSRFDARLFEVVTEFFRDFWWATDPMYLNFYCKKQKSPFIIKCVISALLDHCEYDASTKNTFIDWLKLAVHGIVDPPAQLFMVAGYKIGSAKEQDQVRYGQPCFKKHNIFYQDLPFNKSKPGKLSSLSDFNKNKINEIDFLKTKCLLKFKKVSHTLKNTEIMRLTNVNRLFLSKILNNNIDGISADYLFRVAGHIG